MQCKGVGHFLRVNPVSGDFAVLVEEDEPVAAVPVFDGVEPLVDFATEGFRAKIPVIRR